MYFGVAATGLPLNSVQRRAEVNAVHPGIHILNQSLNWVILKIVIDFYLAL